MQYFNEDGEPIAVDEVTPIDVLEPLRPSNPYKDVAKGYLRIVSLALSYITESEDSKGAAYGVCFALGLNSVLDNRTQADIARELKKSRKMVSYHAKKFSRMAGLEPSPLMKSQEKVDDARAARERNLEQ